MTDTAEGRELALECFDFGSENERGGFKHVFLCGGAGGGAERIRQSLEDRLAVPVQPIDARGAVALSDRIDAPVTLVDALAPVVGLLIRGKVAA